MSYIQAASLCIRTVPAHGNAIHYVLYMYVTSQFKLSFNTNVTKDAVLGPMRIILAASVCEAFSTVCPLTEYKYSPTWEGWRRGEGRKGGEYIMYMYMFNGTLPKELLLGIECTHKVRKKCTTNLCEVEQTTYHVHVQVEAVLQILNYIFLSC